MGTCCGKKEKEFEIVVDEGTLMRPQSDRSELEVIPDTTHHEIKFSRGHWIGQKDGNIEEFYTLNDIIGTGGFGTVKECTLILTGEKRAVKIIPKSKVRFIFDIKNEIEILKKLDHPNIIKIYEFFQDIENYFVVTELCGGGALLDKIIDMARHKEFSEYYTATIMKQILSSLHYCHSRKIVHRDLKPENILLEDNGSDPMIKIIDFGTSMLFKANAKMTTKLGTPYYMAPEVLNKNYNEKCDIWSCGVILFVMLVGYPPFAGDKNEDIFKRIQRGTILFNSRDWKNYSEEGKLLLNKMLTYDPVERISVEEALKDQWFAKFENKVEIESDKLLSSLQNLKKFRSEEKLQRAVLSYISTHLCSKKQEKELARIFNNLDTNHNGLLERSELIDGFHKLYEDDPDLAILQVERILPHIDFNKNECIDYTEFLMANMNKEDVLHSGNLRRAFDMFDKDRNGSITLDEIKEVLGAPMGVSEKFWDDIISEVDSSGNKQMMMNKIYEEEYRMSVIGSEKSQF